MPILASMTPLWQATVVRAYLNEASRLRAASGGVFTDEFLVAVGHNAWYPAALDLTGGWDVNIDVLRQLADACVEEVALRWEADRETIQYLWDSRLWSGHPDHPTNRR